MLKEHSHFVVDTRMVSYTVQLYLDKDVKNEYFKFQRVRDGV